MSTRDDEHEALELKIKTAKEFGLTNVRSLAIASEHTGVRFAVACALAEKESGGRNVYGHDEGGALAGFPFPVNQHNYDVFRWLVFDKGQRSNGVGPMQITSRTLLEAMEDRGLTPWMPLDNMTFGLGLLKQYRQQLGSWEAAGTRYNGSPEYGRDLAAKINAWTERFSR